MGSRNHQNMGVLLLLYFHYLSLLGIDGMSRTWILISDGLLVGHRQMQNCKAALENGARSAR